MSFSRTFVALFLSAGVLMPAVALARDCGLPGNIDNVRAQVIAEINAERRAKGLSALRQNDRLEAAAQSLACDNAARQGASHTSADGTQLQGRLQRAGYAFRAATENVQRGAGGPTAAVEWWMESSGHRANILAQGIGDIGVGVAVSAAPDSTFHWVVSMGQSR